MNYKWIEDEQTALLIERTEFTQMDGMPGDEDRILGGVDTKNGLSLGWAKVDNERYNQLMRHNPEQAKTDVENYLIFKGLLPKSFQSHEKDM